MPGEARSSLNLCPSPGRRHTRGGKEPPGREQSLGTWYGPAPPGLQAAQAQASRGEQERMAQKRARAAPEDREEDSKFRKFILCTYGCFMLLFE